MELETATPAQRRLAERVLAWGEARPTAPGLAAQLRARIEEGLRRGVTPRTSTDRLRLTRTHLDRAVCEGLQLEPRAFVHTAATARGMLARAAVARDVEQAHRDDPSHVVAAVWRDEASRRPGDPASLSAWLNGLDAEAATRLQGAVTDLLVTFREVWPPLPEAAVTVTTARSVEVPLLHGAAVLRASVDLWIDSHRRDERARSLVIDLKAGLPRPERDRRHARWAALLATLGAGRPPFRWVTLHLPEGRPETEDLDAAVLSDTADAVVEVARQLTRLGDLSPGAPEGELALRAGPWCGDCRRRDHCSVRRAAGC